METEYPTYRLGLSSSGSAASPNWENGGPGMDRWLPQLVDGCQGPWFSLEVVDSWAPWAFAKGDPGKVIAALELLATLVAVRLWVPDGDAKKTSRVAIRGYTDNQSNESLLRKAMTTKFPSTLVLMELAEELSAKNCELQLQWIRRDLNQLADDLTNENFASFDPNFRIALKGEALEWRVLGRLLRYATSYFEELGEAKRTKKAVTWGGGGNEVLASVRTRAEAVTWGDWGGGGNEVLASDWGRAGSRRSMLAYAVVKTRYRVESGEHTYLTAFWPVGSHELYARNGKSEDGVDFQQRHEVIRGCSTDLRRRKSGVPCGEKDFNWVHIAQIVLCETGWKDLMSYSGWEEGSHPPLTSYLVGYGNIARQTLSKWRDGYQMLSRIWAVLSTNMDARMIGGEGGGEHQVMVMDGAVAGWWPSEYKQISIEMDKHVSDDIAVCTMCSMDVPWPVGTHEHVAVGPMSQGAINEPSYPRFASPSVSIRHFLAIIPDVPKDDIDTDGLQGIFEDKAWGSPADHETVLIHESVLSAFCRVFKAMVEDLGAKRNVRMLGRKQYNNMTRLFQDCQAECIPPISDKYGFNDEAMSVPMTGILAPARDRAVLQQEIFGPLLPILPVRDVQEAICIINAVATKPLIAYCYTQEGQVEAEFVNNVPAGNIAVNGGPMRMISNYAANFGGTGPSGMGAGFWGRDGLKEFSNRKHVMCGRNGFARSFFSGPPPPA
ncbi:Aldehyde dehydrogenase [Symbiodinium microadriaticum]|uniref:Aldehyde dehydrogenase n=2 Tax=Symbiodinium TaxID=2949 RepID=A0A1Q9C4C5_SYMMI|nr:Aldehyde dehydrogenase [Symbiodinium microadriaticum]